MKALITSLILLVWITVVAPVNLYADNGSDDDYDIELTESSNDDEVITDPKNKGNRSAPMLTSCTISYRNGVTIFSIEGSVNIVSYEIWDIDGETCLGISNDERMFLDALYSNKGEYIVVFTTADKKYMGCIWLD